MKMNFKAGVLFCGGCNPRFDRMKFYQDLLSLCSPKIETCHITFGYYEDLSDPDFLLLINGCACECLLEKAFPCPVVLLNDDDINKALNKIEECIATQLTAM